MNIKAQRDISRELKYSPVLRVLGRVAFTPLVEAAYFPYGLISVYSAQEG